jgi:hypothetical protein
MASASSSHLLGVVVGGGGGCDCAGGGGGGCCALSSSSTPVEVGRAAARGTGVVDGDRCCCCRCCCCCCCCRRGCGRAAQQLPGMAGQTCVRRGAAAGRNNAVTVSPQASACSPQQCYSPGRHRGRGAVRLQQQPCVGSLVQYRVHGLSLAGRWLDWPPSFDESSLAGRRPVPVRCLPAAASAMPAMSQRPAMLLLQPVR